MPVTRLTGEDRVPGTWKRLCFGGYQMALPAEIAEDLKVAVSSPKDNPLSLVVGGRHVDIFLPEKMHREHQGFLKYTKKLRSQKAPRNQPEHTAQVYAANIQSFSWDMPRDDVLLLDWLLLHKPIVCDEDVHFVGYREEDWWNGVLLISDKYLAFTWQAKDGSWGGAFWFEHYAPNDEKWVKDFCESLVIKLPAGVP